MNCLTCGLDTSSKFGEIEFDESSDVQLLPRGMGIAASLLGCLCSDLARSHMCVFGTAKKKRRNRVVNAQTQLPRRSCGTTLQGQETQSSPRQLQNQLRCVVIAHAIRISY